MALTLDQDGNWTDDSKPEIDREDPARKDWERMKQEEAEWLRRHQQEPALQIVPTEQEEEKPHTPTPSEIQKIIDGMDTPAPPARKPYMN